MEHMMEMRNELGDIDLALEALHQNPNNTKIGESPPYYVDIK